MWSPWRLDPAPQACRQHTENLFHRKAAHKASASRPRQCNGFDEDHRLCLQAGMNDHITKPIDPRRLYATPFVWLDGQ